MSWHSANGAEVTGELNDIVAVLPNGQSLTYTVTIAIPDDLETDIVNTAGVSSTVPDPDLANNEATDTDVVCDNCLFDKIPKGISPNGDRFNNVFDLTRQPEIAMLEIFNRYGLKVYERGNYTNQWDGRDSSGKELPSATYYYVIYFKEKKPVTGWVYINRQE